MVQASISVAIVGGGLGGTVLMNALMKYPQLNVQLYEAKAELQERGASVGVGKAAKKALAVLGMDDIVQRANPVSVASSRWVMGEGPDAGEKLFDFVSGLRTVHRAALLKELLAPIPKTNVHTGKKLSSISDKTLYFEDGTSASADLIIGADGIHSNVRKYILGEGHEALDPIFAGFWDCRTVVPASVARVKLGSDRISTETPRQHMYLGNKRMALHDTIDDGQHICIVVGGATPEEWDRTQWKQSVSREWLNNLFQDWGELGGHLVDLVCGEKEEVSTFLQWASARAPKLYNGSVCMMGDAAHATTPWQGSGLGMSIEDSMILSSVLGKCDQVQDIPAALEAYDQIMRPRVQRIIESSHGTGLICCGADGLDAKRLSQELPPRWDYILEWDTEGAANEAVRIFTQLKSSSRHAT